MVRGKIYRIRETEHTHNTQTQEIQMRQCTRQLAVTTCEVQTPTKQVTQQSRQCTQCRGKKTDGEEPSWHRSTTGSKCALLTYSDCGTLNGRLGGDRCGHPSTQCLSTECSSSPKFLEPQKRSRSLRPRRGAGGCSRPGKVAVAA